MKLSTSYINTIQYTRISLEAYYLNSDILNNMKKVLKNKVEKKCNKNGFVDEVYKIIECSDGFLPAENLNGSVIYNIKYQCKLCVPIENTIIIGNVKILNQELVIAINGPILIFIPKDNVDITIWNIIENYENIQTKTKLVSGDYVKIHIVDKRINQNDNQIKAIGKLLDVPTQEEIDKFYLNKNENNYI